MKTAPEYHGQYPMCAPEVIYYDGHSQYICFDPDKPGMGGVGGIENVAWWGSIVPGKPVPPCVQSAELQSKIDANGFENQ